MTPTQNGAAITRGAATLTIDLDDFLRSVGWDDDDDGLDSRRNELVALAARRLADSLQKDIAVAVRDRVEAEVETIVREALVAGVQTVSTWGQPQGAPIPLRDLIGKAAEDALRTPELRDGYGRGLKPTMVQRVIANEVEKAFKAELQTHAKEAQAAAVAAVKKSAADVIGETIDRARRGLS